MATPSSQSSMEPPYPHLAAENTLDAYDSPFQEPLFTLPTASADFSGILLLVFFATFVAWGIFTAVAAYHWFRYGHRSWLAVPAVGIYVAVSAVLILLMASGVNS